MADSPLFGELTASGWIECDKEGPAHMAKSTGSVNYKRSSPRLRKSGAPSAAAPAAASIYRGLDLGTSRIVLATPNGPSVSYTEALNAFVALPLTRMTAKMLEREGFKHEIEGETIYAYGNRVDEFANIFGGDTRRPMQSGLLNPSEPKSRHMLQRLVEHVCGRAKRNEKICFSVPSGLDGHESDVIYHEQSVAQMLEYLGYEARSVNEGLAVVMAELKDSNFTGIGISFGGGMCNVCVAYLGLPVLTFATGRAGDYIDHSTAAVTGKTATTVRQYKEQKFRLDETGDGDLDQALSIYYFDMVSTVIDRLKAELSRTQKLPKLHKAIPILFSGGSAQPHGFQALMMRAVKRASLPIEISDVLPAKTGMNATAKGTLVAAMLNM